MYLNHEEECGERASRMRTVEVVAKSPSLQTLQRKRGRCCRRRAGMERGSEK